MVFFSKQNHCHHGTKPLSSRNFACEISATSAERRLLNGPAFAGGRGYFFAADFVASKKFRDDNGFFFKTKPLSSRNQAIVIAEFRLRNIRDLRRTAALKMGPRSREVADIFSPRLSSRQKNSAMTMIWSRDDNHGMRRRREEKNIFKKRPEFAIWRYNPPSVSFLCRPNAGDAWPDETIPVRSARFSKCAS